MGSVCLRNMPRLGSGRITEIRAGGELAQRVRDMGIIPGTPLVVVGRAPLKDPVAVRIRNYIIALRNSEADYIYVEEAGTEAGADAEYI